MNNKSLPEPLDLQEIQEHLSNVRSEEIETEKAAGPQGRSPFTVVWQLSVAVFYKMNWLVNIGVTMIVFHILPQFGFVVTWSFTKFFVLLTMIDWINNCFKVVSGWGEGRQEYRKVKKYVEDYKEEIELAELLLLANHAYTLRYKYLKASSELMTPEVYERERQDLLRKHRALEVVYADLEGCGVFRPHERALEIISEQVEDDSQLRDAMREVDKLLGREEGSSSITLPLCKDESRVDRKTVVFEETSSSNKK